MSRYHVGSGSFRIPSKKDEILEAFLGSCVGVTLCDTQAEVGGLLHILLPKPVLPESISRPENYATTGLPLFIKALCEAWAQKTNLVACVAGGALVGPVSERDLNFDIGGRTVEVVERMLNAEKIPIQKIETGGYFSCCLSLKLSTLESDIKPIKIPTEHFNEDDSTRPTSTDLEGRMDRVKPIPQIALKLIRMIRDYKHSMEDIAREVPLDQIISAKVIKLCNSALFGAHLAIDSIDRALVILGEKRFLQLVISASLEDFFPENGRGYSLVKGGVFKHALGTAMVSERLASFAGDISPDLAYTAGLLHDMGKVVLDQFIATASPLFYRRIQEEGINLITAEREEFGTTHPVIGGKLAEKWSLPKSLTDTIINHHHPEEAIVYPELTHVVYLADLLMSRFMVGQELERLNTADLAAKLGKIGLTPEQFPALVDSIPRQVFSDPMSSANSS